MHGINRRHVLTPRICIQIKLRLSNNFILSKSASPPMMLMKETVLKPNKSALCSIISQNLYPGLTTNERLAKEIDIPKE